MCCFLEICFQFLHLDLIGITFAYLVLHGETAPSCVQKHALHWGLQASFWSLFSIFSLYKYIFPVEVNLINNFRYTYQDIFYRER